MLQPIDGPARRYLKKENNQCIAIQFQLMVLWQTGKSLTRRRCAPRMKNTSIGLLIMTTFSLLPAAPAFLHFTFIDFPQALRQRSAVGWMTRRRSQSLLSSLVIYSFQPFPKLNLTSSDGISGREGQAQNKSV